MKRIIVLLLLIVSQFANAQKQDLQRAKRLFEKTYYSDAIALYEKLSATNQSYEVVKNLADSYYYTNDYSNAQMQYRFLISNFGDSLSQLEYFRYSETLKAAGELALANKIIRDRLVRNNNNQAVVFFDKKIKNLENVTAIGNRFTIKNEDFNTINSEFGAVLLNGNLVFSGVKNKAGLFDKIYNWNNQLYLDVLVIPATTSAATVRVASSFSDEVNSEMHESNAIFTKDGQTAYFTRNNFIKGRKGVDENKVSNLQIYKAQFIDGKWGEIVALPFNSENYSVEHPALSPDEKILYFASDMPGSYGSFDLYKVEIIGSEFGIPQNLGPEINTAKKEQFPFMSKDSKLYFSSNGHMGYGFMDVFVSETNNGSISKPENVGLPVNSPFDDFSFMIDSETKEGYFSSNRIGGKGSDDIYSLTEIKPLIIEDCYQIVSGIIIDEDTKLPLSNAVVFLEDQGGIQLQKAITLDDGAFSFKVACETQFLVAGSKKAYTNNTKQVKTSLERYKENDASMQLKSEVSIKREQEITVELQKKETIAKIEKEKIEKQIAAEKEKEILAVKKKEKLQKLIATEKDVVLEKDRLLIKTDPIYFDYNLWYIRRDSKIILNRVIEIMKKYPDMVVEIGSHTDNRGNENYNRNLSSNRAVATRKYFLEQGIDSKRILVKGYGETVQIVKCEPSESCTEEQHELNRRSEFVIKSL